MKISSNFERIPSNRRCCSRVIGQSATSPFCRAKELLGDGAVLVSEKSGEADLLICCRPRVNEQTVVKRRESNHRERRKVENQTDLFEGDSAISR